MKSDFDMIFHDKIDMALWMLAGAIPILVPVILILLIPLAWIKDNPPLETHIEKHLIERINGLEIGEYIVVTRDSEGYIRYGRE